MAASYTLTLFSKFLKSSQSGGILLFLCVLISLIVANSSLSGSFHALLATPFGLTIEGLVDLPLTISSFINDGLMAVFFVLVGLEIKREVLKGELSSVKTASLPVIAAIGGMVLPALFYVLFNHGTDTSGGWGIPMATDIAFALAVIAILGKNIPPALKVFLAALAIADDLGAILVIAVFYSSGIHYNYLLMAAGTVALLGLFNYLKIKNLLFYIIPGLLLWYFIHHSGIHATIAGVLLAFMIPADATAENSPLERLEHLLHKPVNLLIMPVFALANTNITFQGTSFSALLNPLALGIMFGLVAGKTIGVTLFSWLAVKFKMGILPSGAGWKHIMGIGALAGIGFTMSIFMATLSFKDITLQENAKMAVLTASLIAGLLGYFYLKLIAKGRQF